MVKLIGIQGIETCRDLPKSLESLIENVPFYVPLFIKSIMVWILLVIGHLGIKDDLATPNSHPTVAPDSTKSLSANPKRGYQKAPINPI